MKRKVRVVTPPREQGKRIIGPTAKPPLFIHRERQLFLSQMEELGRRLVINIDVARAKGML